MKNLPRNIQDFYGLVKNNNIYVDKTKIIYDLVKQEISFFFSRPRRFGKSLTISIIEEIFRGNKDLFKDTWIYNSDWKWEEHPIIKLELSNAGKADEKATIYEKIDEKLNMLFRKNNLQINGVSLGTKLEN